MEPKSLPAVRYYPDGTSVLVETLAEFEALAPGHADHPDGPFPTPPADRWTGGGADAAVPPAAEADGVQQQARAMQQEGMTKRGIATFFGVSPRTVGRWLEEDPPDANG